MPTILSRPRERPRAFLPINTADPLYVGLSTAVNYSGGGGGSGQVYEHVSRQFGGQTSDWTWVPMLDPHNLEWGGGYIPQSTTSQHGISLTGNRLSLWSNGAASPPVAYSFFYLLRPTDATANGVRRVGDTSTFAGTVVYVNYKAGTGATGGYLSCISKTAVNATLNEFWQFPTTNIPWIAVGKSVDPVNGALVYSNVNASALQPGLVNVASSPTAAVSQTYWGAATGGAGNPATIATFGSAIGVTTATPNAQYALFLQWTRQLSLREFNDLYADPYRLWRQAPNNALLSQALTLYPRLGPRNVTPSMGYGPLDI